MASAATSSGFVTGSPKVEVRYVQSATPSQKVATPTVEDNLTVSDDFQKIQEKLEMIPTILVTPTASNAASLPIQYDFFNPRVFGVLLGVVFLVIYVRGLRKK